MNFKKVIFIGVMVVAMLVISGCGQAIIDINKDGSGEVKQVIPQTGFFSAEDIEREIERELGDEVNGLRVRSNNEEIEVTFSFSNISDLDDRAYIVPVADYVVAGQNLDGLIQVDEDLEWSETMEGLALRAPSGLLESDETIIHLPGNVIAHSSNVVLTDSDVVEVSYSGEIIIVYETNSSMAIVWIGLLILIAGGAGGYFYMKKKQTSTETKEEEGEISA
ncbi:LPXTG cell wall anchor domain-containing protein [Evansella sp. AB-P1]|uniref:LPXTG cell wall anchor domain-containing protein n=1 Tax=Evansella sp. AB-P1 TaxID=3037653 RepID=UPI00241E39C5|nr:LPXTG cell wall anchor domain-containing protein [Evansella sp. AB-P1]MDG5789362.1 LPXTG cell wall anchor domain-containing protein [Evansella sp. AB-P1]